MVRTLGVLCAAGAVAGIGPHSFAQSLYIAEVNLLDEGYVHSMNVDGSDLQTLYQTTGGLRGFEIVSARGEAYLSQVDSGTVQRARLDTFDNIETVIDGLHFPQDIAASSQRDVLAWTDPGTRTIGVASLAGDNQRLLVSDISSTSIVIDTHGDWVYFEDRASVSRGGIKRIRVDGTGLETIIDDVPTAQDIALDTLHGYVYWGSSAGFDGTGGIYRVRFDGGGFEEIFVSDHFNFDATTLALDLMNGYVYFAVDISTTEQGIYRMGLNGEDPTFLMGGFDLIPDMSILIPAPGVLVPLALAALLASHRRRA